MDLIKQLHERRLRAWEAAKTVLEAAEAEGRGLDATEEASYQAANSDILALDSRLADLASAEQRKAETESIFADLEARSIIESAGVSSNDALRKFITGESRDGYLASISRAEVRDLTKGTAASGGATLPTSFAGMLYSHLIETATIAGISTVLNTTSGENFELPVTTGHSSGALIAENATITESDPTFAKRTLSSYKYAVAFQAPTELLTDTGVDIEGYLAMQAGRAIGNAFGVHLATGTGSSQPAGIVTGASSGVVGSASVSGAFSADNLIDLYFSVIAPYRNNPKAAWIMKDATLGAVRKLKDTTNQYLWQPSLQVGQPDTLLGKPVYTDPNIAAVALSAKSVLFGDISTYYTRIVNGVRFERSDDFAFGTDQVTFRAILRGDGILADQTGSVKYFIGNAA